MALSAWIDWLVVALSLAGLASLVGFGLARFLLLEAKVAALDECIARRLEEEYEADVRAVRHALAILDGEVEMPVHGGGFAEESGEVA